MCAINPKHTLTFELKVYTSHNIPEDEFKIDVMQRVLLMEQELNKDGRFRFHVSERNDKKIGAEIAPDEINPQGNLEE